MKPGDRVMVHGMAATVVCDVDAGEFSPDYPAAAWADVLKTGLLVMTDEFDLAHYPDAGVAHPISS